MKETVYTCDLCGAEYEHAVISLQGVKGLHGEILMPGNLDRNNRADLCSEKCFWAYMDDLEARRRPIKPEDTIEEVIKKKDQIQEMEKYNIKAENLVVYLRMLSVADVDMRALNYRYYSFMHDGGLIDDNSGMIKITQAGTELMAEIDERLGVYLTGFVE